jgi:hypothetical protein
VNNLSLIGNAVTAGVSILALAVSSWILFRQTKYTRDSNHVQVVRELLREFRTPGFIASLDYVRQRLAKEHDPSRGISGLPNPAREHVLNIGYYYQSLGILVKFNISDSRTFILTMGRQITAAWQAVAPYVYAEREQGVPGVYSLSFFEDLAVKSSALTHEEALRVLKLRRFPRARSQ